MNQFLPLTIKGFKKVYKDKVVELSDHIINKRITLILGKNGSGKSTLLKAISKVIPSEGQISGGYSISYMPEFPHFPEDITIQEFLKQLHQKTNNDYDYNSLLLLFGLKVKENVLIRTLSKGMKTKLNAIP